MSDFYDLARLIDPVDPETFKQDYWEQKPLVISRQDRDYYRDLLSLADIDRLLWTSGIRSPSVRVLRDGREVAVNDHDVFVLQAEGVKHWRLYRESMRLPLAGQPYRKEEAEPAELCAEFDLHPGDAIYIPRGFGHDAVALHSTSLHMTVGIQPVTWALVLLEALEDVIKRNPRFRESLPIGFAIDERTRAVAERCLLELVDDFRHDVRPASTIDNATELALQGIKPFLEGHLLDLEAAPSVRTDTRLRRRPEVNWRLRVDDDTVCLRFHGKLIRMPSLVERDLKFITTHTGEFSAADLPGDLDDASRVTLARRLITEGFLTICRNGS
jgi:hypothetical protein